MSLDVYLTGAKPTPAGSGIFIREDGAMREISRAEWDERMPGYEPVVAITEAEYSYSANITHNLGQMAQAAGIYRHLWRPDEIGIDKAFDLVEPLAGGLNRLKADPERFKELNPPNGWGTYEALVRFVEGYLDACRADPTATVEVSR